VINPYGWIYHSLHHDALVFDLHQSIEVVEHMALEKPWLGLNTKYKLVLFYF
jgi:hypothetical protein